MEEKTYTTHSGAVRYWLDTCAHDNAPWVVFLPGLTADHTLFNDQLSYFAGKVNCFAWDAPAHGKSRPYPLDFSMDDYARILHEILNTEGIKAPIIAGQSLGGYLAQCYHFLFPGDLAGIVSIDSAPLGRSHYAAWELSALKHTRLMYLSIPWRLLLRWGSKGCAATARGRENMRTMMQCYGRREYCELAAHGYRMLANAVEQNRDYRVACPLLLMCGQHDSAGSTKRYNRMWAKRENRKLVWIENAGHNSTVDNPQAVNAAIEAFLDECASRR